MYVLFTVGGLLTCQPDCQVKYPFFKKNNNNNQTLFF